MTATWEEPITFLPMAAAYPVKYCIPSVSHLKDCKSWGTKSEAEHTEETLCALRHGADFHLMDLPQGLEKK